MSPQNTSGGPGVNSAAAKSYQIEVAGGHDLRSTNTTGIKTENASILLVWCHPSVRKTVSHLHYKSASCCQRFQTAPVFLLVQTQTAAEVSNQNGFSSVYKLLCLSGCKTLSSVNTRRISRTSLLESMNLNMIVSTMSTYVCACGVNQTHSVPACTHLHTGEFRCSYSL